MEEKEKLTSKNNINKEGKDIKETTKQNEVKQK